MTRVRHTRTLLALLADRLALWRNFFHRPRRYLHSREEKPPSKEEKPRAPGPR